MEINTNYMGVNWYVSGNGDVLQTQVAKSAICYFNKNINVKFGNYIQKIFKKEIKIYLS